MSERESQRRTERGAHSQADQDDVAAETVEAGSEQSRSDQLDDDVDSILDEIDGVLETNAAEFIASFVQKGGQ
jgi:ubiquitin-like protein Pup